ncbi:MAG: hypothetical protein AAF581_05515 [Planctomycetota bacterium]
MTLSKDTQGALRWTTVALLLLSTVLLSGCAQRHFRHERMAYSIAANTVNHIQVPLDEVVVTVPTGLGTYRNLHVQLTVDVDRYALNKIADKLRGERAVLDQDGVLPTSVAGAAADQAQVTEQQAVDSSNQLPLIWFLFGISKADVVETIRNRDQLRSFQSLIAAKTVEVALDETSTYQLDLAKIRNRLVAEYSSIFPGAVERRLDLVEGALSCAQVTVTSLYLTELSGGARKASP